MRGKVDKSKGMLRSGVSSHSPFLSSQVNCAAAGAQVVSVQTLAWTEALQLLISDHRVYCISRATKLQVKFDTISPEPLVTVSPPKGAMATLL